VELFVCTDKVLKDYGFRQNLDSTSELHMHHFKINWKDKELLIDKITTLWFSVS